MAIKKSSKSQSPVQGSSARAGRITARFVATVSVVLAVALVVLLNYLVQYVGGRDAGRWDLQTQDRYGISGRTEGIVRQVGQPVRLTVMYTSPEKERLGAEYGPRVAELCHDMARLNPKIDVTNVRDDNDKRELLTRLGDKARQKAAEHEAMLTEFDKFAQQATLTISEEITRWRSMQAATLLNQHELPAVVSRALNEVKTVLDEAEASIRIDRRSGSIPNYARLTEQASKAAEAVAKTLDAVDNYLRQLNGLVTNIAANDAQVVKNAEASDARVTAAADELSQALQETPPEDPAQAAAVLKKYVDAAGALMAALTAQNQAMQNFVRTNPLIRQQPAFLQEVPMGGLSALQPLDDYQGQIAGALAMMTAEARRTQADDAPYRHKALLDELHPRLIDLLERARKASAGWVKVLQSLQEVDSESKTVLARAEKGLLSGITAPARQLVAAAAALPPVEQNDLAAQLAEDNVVLVETEQQTAVIDFDNVWPVASAQTADETAGPRRAFNGDQAIGGKLLELTRDQPLGQVVLTYYLFLPPEDLPPQIIQQVQPVFGDIPPQYVQVLRDQIEQARLEVVEWNLAEGVDPFVRPDMAAPIPDPPPAKEGLKRMLLVLPPPPPNPVSFGGMPMPELTPAHMAKIAAEIDSGTPALFLTNYSSRFAYMGEQAIAGNPMYEYLRQSWGIDAKIGQRVVQGIPNPSDPTRYSIAQDAWSWLPLGDFTDHPVGEPLRARQLYWLSVCPVTPAETVPQNVRIEPVLNVDAGQSNVWATAAADELGEKLQSGETINVAPGETKGAILPPFSVVVAAEKTFGAGTNRAVVAGVGMTYYTAYLRYPARRILPSGVIAADPPPVGTLDLAVNACYWLLEQEEYIGAGAVDTAPIGYVSPRAMRTLRLLVMGGLPALALLIGLGVLLVRRR